MNITLENYCKFSINDIKNISDLKLQKAILEEIKMTFDKGDTQDKYINIEKIKLKLYLLFITPDGSIVYEEHAHFATNFKLKLLYELDFKPIFITQDTDEKLRESLECHLKRYKIFNIEKEIVIYHI